MDAEALKLLDQVEAEMRRVGYWSSALEQPDAMCGAKFRSYLDAPSFPLWLQGLFLPNARAAALEGSLPRRSQAGEIARRQYAAYVDAPEARRLFELIQAFDDLCQRTAAKRNGE